MNLSSKPKSIITMLAMLVLLIALSLLSLFTSAPMLFGRAPGAFSGRGNTGRPGAMPNGNDANGQNFQRGNGGTDQNFQRGNNGGNFQGRSGYAGFNLFSLTRSFGLNPRVMVYVGLGIGVLGLVLLGLSLFGLWQMKKWGLNLAMLVGLFFLLGALPGLFSFGGRNINWFRSVINILTFIATLPLIFLGLLPSVRDYFPRK